MNKILITAHPRSGTGYISKFLNLCGLDVPHEIRLGNNGISNWRGIIENINDCNYVLHQVRNPIDVISSSTIIMGTSWEYLYRNLNIPMINDKILRSMTTYYNWNKLIESKKPDFRYRIEDIDNIDILRIIFTYFNCNIPSIIPFVCKDYNTKFGFRKMFVNWEIMEDLDKQLCYNIRKMSVDYGYL
jgi:hypothetical protein